ncbi:hypothetical protein MLD38_015458 [Melastoma candidum]|uniref:Uncharacterized protein n=1 Tax=Melastoma candidum TaxID=119954 RepID=A0ACB9RJA3_9MYRT|nr:hypothetical protein MLD38_015458 [Melastoma candidum]
MHGDPEYWANPLEFHPERFLGDGTTVGAEDYNGGCLFYMPFGAGRRICAGLVLGERMLMYVLERNFKNALTFDFFRTSSFEFGYHC